MRRALSVVFLALALLVAGCASGAGPAAPPSPAPTSSSAPILLVMPDVVGQNADVALDQLHRAGFTNVDLGTVDGRNVVILPQNWVVKTQSAKSGGRLAADAKIVLGCARIGGTHWPWQDSFSYGRVGTSSGCRLSQRILR